MANGTTLTIVTRADRDYVGATTLSDAGDPGAGSVEVIYDDDEDQEDIVRALQHAIAYVTQNVTSR